MWLVAASLITATLAPGNAVAFASMVPVREIGVRAEFRSAPRTVHACFNTFRLKLCM